MPFSEFKFITSSNDGSGENVKAHKNKVGGGGGDYKATICDLPVVI